MVGSKIIKKWMAVLMLSCFFCNSIQLSVWADVSATLTDQNQWVPTVDPDQSQRTSEGSSTTITSQTNFENSSPLSAVTPQPTSEQIIQDHLDAASQTVNNVTVSSTILDFAPMETKLKETISALKVIMKSLTDALTDKGDDVNDVKKAEDDFNVTAGNWMKELYGRVLSAGRLLINSIDGAVAGVVGLGAVAVQTVTYQNLKVDLKSNNEIKPAQDLMLDAVKEDPVVGQILKPQGIGLLKAGTIAIHTTNPQQSLEPNLSLTLQPDGTVAVKYGPIITGQGHIEIVSRISECVNAPCPIVYDYKLVIDSFSHPGYQPEIELEADPSGNQLFLIKKVVLNQVPAGVANGVAIMQQTIFYENNLPTLIQGNNFSCPTGQSGCTVETAEKGHAFEYHMEYVDTLGGFKVSKFSGYMKSWIGAKSAGQGVVEVPFVYCTQYDNQGRAVRNVGVNGYTENGVLKTTIFATDTDYAGGIGTSYFKEDSNINYFNTVDSMDDWQSVVDLSTIKQQMYWSGGVYNSQGYLYSVYSARDQNGNFVARQTTAPYHLIQAQGHIVVGQPDVLSGETDDIKVNGSDTFPDGITVGLGIAQDFGYAGHFAYDKNIQLGLTFYDSDKIAAVIDFPREDTIVLRGKHYQVSIDANAKVVLTEIPVGVVTVPGGVPTINRFMNAWEDFQIEVTADGTVRTNYASLRPAGKIEKIDVSCIQAPCPSQYKARFENPWGNGHEGSYIEILIEGDLSGQSAFSVQSYTAHIVTLHSNGTQVVQHNVYSYSENRIFSVLGRVESADGEIFEELTTVEYERVDNVDRVKGTVWHATIVNPQKSWFKPATMDSREDRIYNAAGQVEKIIRIESNRVADEVVRQATGTVYDTQTGDALERYEVLATADDLLNQIPSRDWNELVSSAQVRTQLYNYFVVSGFSGRNPGVTVYSKKDLSGIFVYWASEKMTWSPAPDSRYLFDRHFIVGEPDAITPSESNDIYYQYAVDLATYPDAQKYSWGMGLAQEAWPPKSPNAPANEYPYLVAMINKSFGIYFTDKTVDPTLGYMPIVATVDYPDQDKFVLGGITYKISLNVEGKFIFQNLTELEDGRTERLAAVNRGRALLNARLSIVNGYLADANSLATARNSINASEVTSQMAELADYLTNVRVSEAQKASVQALLDSWIALKAIGDDFDAKRTLLEAEVVGIQNFFNAWDEYEAQLLTAKTMEELNAISMAAVPNLNSTSLHRDYFDAHFALLQDYQLQATALKTQIVNSLRPPLPVSVYSIPANAEDGGVDANILNWESVGATTYRVYRRIFGGTAWTQIGETLPGAIRYIDTAMDSSRAYQYEVRPLDIDNQEQTAVSLIQSANYRDAYDGLQPHNILVLMNMSDLGYVNIADEIEGYETANGKLDPLTEAGLLQYIGLAQNAWQDADGNGVSVIADWNLIKYADGTIKVPLGVYYAMRRDIPIENLLFLTDIPTAERAYLNDYQFQQLVTDKIVAHMREKGITDRILSVASVYRFPLQGPNIAEVNGSGSWEWALSRGLAKSFSAGSAHSDGLANIGVGRPISRQLGDLGFTATRIDAQDVRTSKRMIDDAIWAEENYHFGDPNWIQNESNLRAFFDYGGKYSGYDVNFKLAAEYALQSGYFSREGDPSCDHTATECSMTNFAMAADIYNNYVNAHPEYDQDRDGRLDNTFLRIGWYDYLTYQDYYDMARGAIGWNLDSASGNSFRESPDFYFNLFGDLESLELYSGQYVYGADYYSPDYPGNPDMPKHLDVLTLFVELMNGQHSDLDQTALRTAAEARDWNALATLFNPKKSGAYDLSRLNVTAENSSFYDSVMGWVSQPVRDSLLANAEIQRLVQMTDSIRSGDIHSLTSEQQNQVRMLNRLVLDLIFNDAPIGVKVPTAYRLWEQIKNRFAGLAVQISHDPLENINNLLHQPDLFDRWKATQNPADMQRYETEQLMRNLLLETESYRSQPWDLLDANQKNSITTLNRFIAVNNYWLLRGRDARYDGQVWGSGFINDLYADDGTLLKRGAVATLGAISEPGLGGHTNPRDYTFNLMNGFAFGELTSSGQSGFRQMSYNGDPLYRPYPRVHGVDSLMVTPSGYRQVLSQALGASNNEVTESYREHNLDGRLVREKLENGTEIQYLESGQTAVFINNRTASTRTVIVYGVEGNLISQFNIPQVRINDAGIASDMLVITENNDIQVKRTYAGSAQVERFSSTGALIQIHSDTVIRWQSFSSFSMAAWDVVTQVSGQSRNGSSSLFVTDWRDPVTGNQVQVEYDSYFESPVKITMSDANGVQIFQANLATGENPDEDSNNNYYQINFENNEDDFQFNRISVERGSNLLDAKGVATALIHFATVIHANSSGWDVASQSLIGLSWQTVTNSYFYSGALQGGYKVNGFEIKTATEDTYQSATQSVQIIKHANGDIRSVAVSGFEAGISVQVNVNQRSFQISISNPALVLQDVEVLSAYELSQFMNGLNLPGAVVTPSGNLFSGGQVNVSLLSFISTMRTRVAAFDASMGISYEQSNSSIIKNITQTLTNISQLISLVDIRRINPLNQQLETFRLSPESLILPGGNQANIGLILIAPSGDKLVFNPQNNQLSWAKLVNGDFLEYEFQNGVSRIKTIIRVNGSRESPFYNAAGQWFGTLTIDAQGERAYKDRSGNIIARSVNKVATFYVSASGVFNTVQNVVLLAQDGDIIEITDAVFHEPVQFGIYKSLTIRGAGAGAVIDGNEKGVMFASVYGANVKFENLTFRNYNFSYLGATEHLIKVQENAKLTLDHVVFEDNTGGRPYSANLVSVDKGHLRLEDFICRNNQLGEGACVSLYSGFSTLNSPASTLKVNNSIFENNRTYGGAAAIRVNGMSYANRLALGFTPPALLADMPLDPETNQRYEVVIADSIFRNNTNDYKYTYEGAVTISDLKALVSHVDFVNTTGTALSLRGGAARVEYSLFKGNSDYYYSAIHSAPVGAGSPQLILDHNTFVSNLVTSPVSIPHGVVGIVGEVFNKLPATQNVVMNANIFSANFIGVLANSGASLAVTDTMSDFEDFAGSGNVRGPAPFYNSNNGEYQILRSSSAQTNGVAWGSEGFVTAEQAALVDVPRQIRIDAIAQRIANMRQSIVNANNGMAGVIDRLTAANADSAVNAAAITDELDDLIGRLNILKEDPSLPADMLEMLQVGIDGLSELSDQIKYELEMYQVDNSGRVSGYQAVVAGFNGVIDAWIVNTADPIVERLRNAETMEMLNAVVMPAWNKVPYLMSAPQFSIYMPAYPEDVIWLAQDLEWQAIDALSKVVVQPVANVSSETSSFPSSDEILIPVVDFRLQRDVEGKKVMLVWSKEDGIKYEIQLSTAADFSGDIQTVRVDGSAYELVSADQTRHYRIRAVSSSGDVSMWSSPLTIDSTVFAFEDVMTLLDPVLS